MLRAGEALVRLVGIWSARRYDPDVQSMLDAWNSYLHWTADVQELQMPKRHLCTHMLVRASFFGSPVLYACWEDESLNRNFKMSCRIVSQMTFESFLLLRMREAMRIRNADRKRKQEQQD